VIVANCPEIYVKKWVDYQTKYGVGYLLSDDSAGVFFNDCTKIILDTKKDYFEYIEKGDGGKDHVVSGYFLRSFPKELKKKVTLLEHFRSHLLGTRRQE
jgi:polo-like kinase 1